MVIYLYGSDTKRSREHLEKMVEKFYRERDPQRLNVCRIVVGGEDAGDVRGQLLTAPFLADKRLVVVERMVESGDADLLAWFTDRFLEKEPPSDTIVILWEEEPVKKSKNGGEVLHARLSQTKFAQSFEQLEGKKREDWVVRLITDRGGKITTDAVQELHRRVSDDFALTNAVDTLVSFVDGAPITHKELDLFLPPDIENKIFDAMDNLASKKRDVAMKLLAQVWYVDNDPVYIFAMLHRQVRLLLQTRELVDDNPQISEQTVSKQLGVHAFVAKKLLGQARSWTRADLVAWYDRLIEIDYAIKHGTTDPRVLIDKFVAA